MIIKKLRKLICLSVLIVLSISISSCKSDGLEKVKVAEVAHSVFYAPQYVALHNGYFKDEGLDIEIITANGADKVTASLLSGDAKIGLQGAEPTIYLYNNNSSEFLINFAQLTTTDGSFIFGREKIDNFNISMLKGKSILGGRLGGMPLMTLEYAIKKNGLTVSRNSFEKDVNVRTDVAFGAMAGAFLSGEGDFTTLFEPTASEMANSGKIFLLESVGRLAGEVAFTSYSCTNKFFENSKDTLEKFVKAIYKGQQFVYSHTDKEVAEVIKLSFNDISLDTLTSVVKRYREINAWNKTPVFSENAYNNVQDIMVLANELEKKVEFNKVVDNSIALKVLNK